MVEVLFRLKPYHLEALEGNGPPGDDGHSVMIGDKEIGRVWVVQLIDVDKSKVKKVTNHWMANFNDEYGPIETFPTKEEGTEFVWREYVKEMMSFLESA